MTKTGNTSSGSAIVTSVTPNTSDVYAGMSVTGTGIPAGTTILSVNSSSQITLSANATATGTGVTLEINTLLQGSGSTSTGTGGLSPSYPYPWIDITLTVEPGLSGVGVAKALPGGGIPWKDIALYVETSGLSAAVSAGGVAAGNVELLKSLAADGIAEADHSVSLSASLSLAALTVSAGASVSAALTVSADSLLVAAKYGRATIAAALSVTTSAMAAEVSGRVTVSGNLTVAQLGLSAAASSHSSGSAAISCAADIIARAGGSAKTDATLSMEMTIRTANTTRGEAVTGTACVTLVGAGLGVCDVIQDILLLWGIEDARMSVEYLRERAMSDLNAALQIVWSRAKDRDYFSRRTLTVHFPAGTGGVELDMGVQNVLGPVRLASDRGNLRPLSSRSQLDLFAHIFLGKTGSAVPDGRPQAFFAERLNQSRPDNAQITLHVIPAPDANTDILVDAAMECPRYEWRDFCECTPIHIPHRYAESVLLPVARYRAMSSHYFIKEDRRPAIESEYATAMGILGEFDPRPKEIEESRKEGGER